MAIYRSDPSGERDPDDPTGEGRAGYLAWELHLWSTEARRMLQQLLEGNDIPYVWEGTDLVVPAAFEEQVDDLVAHVDAAGEPPLDPDADKILYELADWDDDLVNALADVISNAGVAYDFDIDGNLVVLAEDEDRVDALIESVETAAASPDDDDASGTADDGLVAQDVLSDLFVAADRLRHHARDPDGVLGLVEAAPRAQQLALPFGFDPRVWDTIVERAGALCTAIEEDTESDEEIEEQADALRSLLRDLV